MNLFAIMTAALVEAVVVLLICAWTRRIIWRKLLADKTDQRLSIDNLSAAELAYIANNGNHNSVCSAAVVDKIENGTETSDAHATASEVSGKLTAEQLIQAHVNDPSRTRLSLWSQFNSFAISNMFGDRVPLFLAAHIVPAKLSERLGFRRLYGLTRRVRQTDSYVQMRKDLTEKLIKTGWLCEKDAVRRARKHLMILSPFPIFGTSQLIIITFCAMVNEPVCRDQAITVYMFLVFYSAWVAICLPPVLLAYWLVFSRSQPVWEYLAWSGTEVPNRVASAGGIASVGPDIEANCCSCRDCCQLVCDKPGHGLDNRA